MLDIQGGLDVIEEQFVKFHLNEIHAFSQQAEDGDTEALYHLASLILKDCPSPRFWDEGIRLLEIASEAGHVEAKKMLMDLTDKNEQFASEAQIKEDLEEGVIDPEEIGLDTLKNIPHYAPKIIKLHKEPHSKLLFSKKLIDTRMENIAFILMYLAISMVPAFIVYYVSMHWIFYTDGMDLSGFHFSWWRYAASFLLVAFVICVPVLLSLRKHYRSIVVSDGIVFLFSWDNGLRTCLIKPNDISRVELSRSLVKIYTDHPVFEDKLKALHAPISGKSKNELAQALIRAGFQHIKVQ